MTDPTIQIVATPLFTPLFPLSLDDAGLLEGTHVSTYSEVKKTDQYRTAIALDQVWRMAELSRLRVFGPLPAPQVLERDKDTGDARRTFTPDPPEARIQATLIWFKGNKESLAFAHPYADVKRLWNEYLLRQVSPPAYGGGVHRGERT